MPKKSKQLHHLTDIFAEFPHTLVSYEYDMSLFVELLFYLEMQAHVLIFIILLQDLLDYLITYITRLIANDKSAIATKKSGDSVSLHRDIYGFRKILVFVTPKKLIALDSARKGEIVWTRYLNYASLDLQKIFVVRAAMIKYPPVIIVLGKQIVSGVCKMHYLTGCYDFVYLTTFYVTTLN